MIDRILTALSCGNGSCPCAQSVRKGRGLVHCCSHSDPTPSLNVSPGKSVDVVVTCHGGCEQSAVIAELKTLGLWTIVNDGVPFSSPEPRREAARYHYEDRDGKPLYDVIRYEPKDFRASRPVPEDERVLYHLPEVIAAVARKDTIYVTEGEKDADALRSLGLTATCNPFGGGKWLDRYSTDLIGANVIICQDRDEVNPKTGQRAGEQASRVVAQSLSVAARSVKILQFPGPGKDSADWVASGGSLVALAVLLDELPEWTSGERVVFTARDRAIEYREVMEKRKRGDPDEVGWRIGLSSLDKEMAYSPGDVMLVAAATGTGKTSFLQSLERRATVPTMFFSVEMSRKQLMNRHMAAATGIDSWKIRRGALNAEEYAAVMSEIDRMEHDDGGAMVDNPALTTAALESILRIYRVKYGVRVAFVDHIQRLADKNAESERLRMAGIMRSLSRIARQTETQLVVACQVNRAGDRASGVPPFKSELAESGVLEQEAAVILALGRAEGATETKLAVRKNRHGLDGFTVDLVFDLMHNNYLEQSEARMARLDARQEIPF